MAITRTCVYAWILFVASTIASVYCYAKLSELQTTSSGLVENLHLGETFYGIGAPNECIGFLKINIREENGELALKGSGEVRASLFGERSLVNLESGGDFNALRQLGGAYIRFTGDRGSLIVSLLNIHPIAVAAKLNQQGAIQEWKTSIPGPITIRKEENKTLTVEAKSLINEQHQFQSVTQQPLFKKFALFEARAVGQQEVCENRQGTALVIDSLLQFLKNLSAPI